MKERHPSWTAENDLQRRSAVARNSDPDGPVAYEIKLRGYLEEHWRDWLGGLEISHDGQGHTLLTGFVSDQAALHGILAQIRDLGLPLISIIPQHRDDERAGRDDSLTR